jgi:hypothetical protein
MYYVSFPIASSAESLYFETGWSKLEDHRKSRKLNLFYKIENNMAPTYLSDCLPTTIGETVNGIYLISILVFVKCEFVWSPFDMCCLYDSTIYSY